MTPSPAVLTVAPLEGDAIWFNGALQNVKLPGSFGDDALCVVEVTSTAGRATGLHTDPSNETFYVLEGELLFHVDGREYPAPAGQTITIRSGVPHAFMIASPVARFLVMNTPGTQERFFRAGGEPATGRDLDAAPPPDLERTMAAARAFGIDFIGPPPFAADALRAVSGAEG